MTRPSVTLNQQHKPKLEFGEYQREQSNIEARVQTLRSEVNRAERRVRPSLPQNQSAEQVESALARELSLLASLRLSLRDAEARAEERVRRPQ